MRAMIAALAVLLLTLLMGVIGPLQVAGPAFAQYDNYLPPPPFLPPAIVIVPPGAVPNPGGGVEPGPGTVSPGTTSQVVAEIKAGIAFCRAMPQDAYAVDCLSDQLEKSARSLPGTGDYADARKALMDAAGKLHALATRYADPKMSRGYARSPGGASSTRPLTAVRRDALPEVKRQARAIVAEAQTVLLRSAETSARRKAHYEQISAAVGSANKVLLRSG